MAVTAVVVVKEGHTFDENELLAKLRDHLSPFKCPKRILTTAAMPKTATGKVQKGKLRAELAGTYQS
jgi:acyl-coenzyme A synthetase/AMP-(fatty) acid ligase